METCGVFFFWGPEPKIADHPHREGLTHDFLGLFHGNGVFFTNFDAAFAAEALFGIHRHGFSILHLENFHRTNIHAFFTTGTFVFVHSGYKSHDRISFLTIFKSGDDFRPPWVSHHRDRYDAEESTATCEAGGLDFRP
jgi:hypothetical protein